MEELALLSAVVLEGHIKYKVDSLSDAVYEHAQALKVGVTILFRFEDGFMSFLSLIIFTPSQGSRTQENGNII